MTDPCAICGDSIEHSPRHWNTRSSDFCPGIVSDERCSTCGYTLSAHHEQDPAKRRFGMCERGLTKVER